MILQSQNWGREPTKNRTAKSASMFLASLAFARDSCGRRCFSSFDRTYWKNESIAVTPARSSPYSCEACAQGRVSD